MKAARVVRSVLLKLQTKKTAGSVPDKYAGFVLWVVDARWIIWKARIIRFQIWLSRWWNLKVRDFEQEPDDCQWKLSHKGKAGVNGR